MKTVYDKFNRVLAGLLLGLGLLLIGGCGGKSHIRDFPDEQRRQSEKPISAKGYNHFVNANLLELVGAYNEAIDEYQNALSYFPNSATIRTDYARMLFRMQKVNSALDQALLIEPKSAEIYLLIGDCYRFLNQSELARKNYGKSIELDPDNINAHWYLAEYYRQSGQNDSLISAYYELARLSETYRIWQELGTMLGSARRYTEAVNVYNKAIEINPAKENLNSFLGLAATYDALDSLERAQEYLKKAIELDRFDVRIFRQMVSMYLSRQDIPNAILSSEQLVALVPSDWVAQRRLGVLLYTDGQLDRADSLFESRIAFGDENVLNYFYRGRVAIEQDRLADGTGFMQAAIKSDSAFADGWLNLGFIYRGLDSLENSIEVLRTGLDYCKEEPTAVTRLLFALGSMLERNGQFQDAVSTFQELLRLDADNAPALNYLGYMLADRNQQLSYALELVERAIALSPENGAYIDSYAWVHFRLGNYDMALAELNRAVDLINDDAVIYEHMGDVYKEIGDLQKAREYYNQALKIDPESIKIEEKLGQ